MAFEENIIHSRGAPFGLLKFVKQNVRIRCALRLNFNKSSQLNLHNLES
jgi:hypothetical protein